MKKRWIAAFLVIVLLATLLTGCNKEEGPAGKPDPSNPSMSSPAAESARGKYAYQAEYIPIELGDIDMQGIYNFCVTDHSLYFYGDCMVGEEPLLDPITGEPIIDEFTNEPFLNYIFETKIFRMDLETQEISPLSGYEPTVLPEGQEGNVYVSGIQAGADNSIWLTEQVSSYYFDLPEDFNAETDDPYMYYTQGENKILLHQISDSGETLQVVELQLQDTYLSTILVLDDGKICSTDWQNILFYDQNGTQTGSISMEDYNLQNLFNMGDGRVAVSLWQDGTSYMADVDINAMTLGEKVTLPPNAYMLYPPIDDYDFVYDFSGTFFGYDTETGESEKLFSWLDCDVDSNGLSGMVSIADGGQVYTIESVYNGESVDYSLIVMNPVDPATLPVKQELTLACFYLDWELRSDIVAFNKSHDDVRIVVKEYSQYATEENHLAGIQKLNTEIMSGMVPDLFQFNPEMPADQYAAKGILADLWPLIDADPELSREDLMVHFFDSLSQDGKLYQIVDSFSISTLAGKTSVVGTGTSWTMDELMAALDQQPEGTTIFGMYDTKESILVNCVARNAESFIDWNTLQCSFNSQEFIDLLKFANQFPAEIDHQGIYDEIAIDVDLGNEAVLLRSGKQMLYRVGLYGFSSLQWANAVFGEDVNFIGYPTTENNGSCFEIYGGLGISSTCANTDAAWSLIRTYLTEEHQTQEYMYQFPTNKHSFDAMVEQAMTMQYYKDYETGEDVPAPSTSIWYGENDELMIYTLTQDELDLFMDIYNNTTTFYSYNQEITTLISEEAAAFFDGKKTAEEAAGLIQDRVGLYVMENG